MVYTINPILIAAAVIPAIILLVKVEKCDRLEKESPSLLISLVLFGIASTAVAALLERVGMALLGRLFPEENLLYDILLFFGVVAFAASSTVWCTACSWPWALRCGRTSAMSPCSASMSPSSAP